MKQISINLNNKCNFRCKYCFVTDKHNSEISWNDLDRSLEVCNEHLEKDGRIHFFGTEPMLSREKLYYAIENSKHPTGITTNSSLILDTDAKFFKKHNVYVLCSYDGLPKSHNSFRVYKGGAPTWRDVVTGILRLHKEGLITGCAMSVVPENVPYLLENVRSAHTLGFQMIALNKIVDSWPTSYDIDLLREKLREVGQFYLTLNDTDIQFFTKSCIAWFRRAGPGRERWTCGACWGSFGIDWNGQIIPCHRMTWFDMGNIWDGINQEKLEYIRSIDFNECHQCPIWPCGTCYESNYRDTGDICKLNVQSCKYEAVRYETSREIFSEWVKNHAIRRLGHQ